MPRPRLLVADDNPLSLRFFADALDALGIDSVLAADGEQALARADGGAFDALILDLRMPGLGGAQVLARLRGGSGPCRDAPALASSAGLDAARARALQASGFTAALDKPLTLAALAAALANVLPAWSRPVAADGDVLDDAQALAAAAGDAGIVRALRGLFDAELAALPTEIAALTASADVAALRERLHRLDASAGFCGARGLQRAIAALRSALSDAQWPDATCAALLVSASQVRAALAAPAADC